MTSPRIGIVQSEAQDRAIATLTAAFLNDPVLRWVYPDSHRYLDAFPRVAIAFAGAAFGARSAHVAQDFAGVALWLPPGSHSDEETMAAILEETVDDARKEEVYGVLGQMSSFRPSQPHWYLPMIGVDPVKQGGGLGSALLAHALEICDSQGLPAYLESTSPRNTALYERHGFASIGSIQAGDSPTINPMLRNAR